MKCSVAAHNAARREAALILGKTTFFPRMSALKWQHFKANLLLCEDRFAEKRCFRLTHAAFGGTPDFRPAASIP
ncbi:hypothetical protein FYJ44_11495 [Desulfovibrio sp. PG-178-WT-4]|uniref:Uncharacterized protein n=1 Tax=Desulfovibrio porci TaxID=2605782 RepID=A0A6L5XP29_9BACT|nr:hypothetical protein [Desulfovibrio porci]MSS28641.1 hypothetical protein [Desulfovibrio porci]